MKQQSISQQNLTFANVSDMLINNNTRSKTKKRYTKIY